MRRQDQIAEARKLLAHVSDRTTALADGVYRNPVTDYTSPQQGAREREVFFRNGPINIGLRALLPNAGDWMTHDYAGVPILLVRRADGSLGAFLNVCRHRGARVAEGCGNGARSFSCPYHGWTYGLDGSPGGAAGGSLVRRGRAGDARFARAPGRRETRHDLGRPEPRYGARCRQPCWVARRTISPPTASAPTTITKPACCGAR